MALPTPPELVQQLHWRYATKQFDPSRRIPGEIWAALESALVLAPSSFGLQPWRFYVVADPALRARLLPQSWGQKQVVEASHFVVFTIKKNIGPADADRFIARSAEVRGVPASSLEGYRGVIHGFLSQPKEAFSVDAWAARQAYIALGGLMTAAAMLGIDTCPMEGLNPAGYDEVLGLAAEGYATVCACALGYRAPSDKYASLPKVRYLTSEVVRTLS